MVLGHIKWVAGKPLHHDRSYLSEKVRAEVGIQPFQLIKEKYLEEVGDSEVLGCHQIEQLRGRFEVENLILNENFGVAQFVPARLRLHDPDEGVRLSGELLVSKKVPQQKVGMDPGGAAGGELITVFYSIQRLNSLDVFLCVQFFHDLVPSISARFGSKSKTTNKRNIRYFCSVDNNKYYYNFD